jgi:hypothetical protein
MSNTQKHKKRGLEEREIAAKFLGRPTESILDEMILRAVKDKRSPWPIDRRFKAVGSFKTRYKLGDRQILLWAIWDSAQREEPIPKWATEALRDRVLRAAKGEFATWDGAFGKIYAGRRQQRSIQTLASMIDVWKCVWKHVIKSRDKIGKDLFTLVGKELTLQSSSATTVQNLYRDARDYFKLLHREELKHASKSRARTHKSSSVIAAL